MSHGELVWGLSGSYVLLEHEVHVWRTTLAMPESGISKFRQTLSPEERERADRFSFEVDRKRSVIGRGLLRLLLGHILDLAASELRFEYDEVGKPKLIAGQGLPLQFN